MTNKNLFAAAAAVALLAGGGYGLYRLGVTQGARAPMSTTVPTSSMPASSSATPRVSGAAEGPEATKRQMASGLKAGDTDPVAGRRILYWQDPMSPATRFDKPGKSPFMDMMLSPVYAGADADAGGLSINPRIEQNLGIRTVDVVEDSLAPAVTTVGTIAFNERDQAVVQARAAGFVEHVYVRATLEPVREGAPLVDLYVPDWIAAQEEFLSVKRLRGVELGGVVDAARQRMRQLGMSDGLIRSVETSGQPQARLTITAPVSGVATEIGVREGMTVSPGMTLMRLNGLGSVWAEAQVPESQAGLIRVGASVRATASASPGRALTGRVQALVPGVDAATRTLKARVELANPGAALVPGMTVNMTFVASSDQRRVMVVPTEAVIRTGRRTVVMLAGDGGAFKPVDVETGAESGGRIEIRSGLQAGQRVVVSGQFLIDSEASLRGLEAKVGGSIAPPAAASSAEAPSMPSPPGPPAAATTTHHGTGRIEAIDSGEVTLSHGAITTLKWPAMTMPFKVPKGGVPPGLKVGDTVDFEFVQQADGDARLTSIHPAAGTTPPHAGGHS